MKKRIYILFFFLGILVFLLIKCSSMPKAENEYYNMVVVVGSDSFAQKEKIIPYFLSMPYNTGLKEENTYEITLVDEKKFPDYMHRKTIFIVAAEDENNELSKMISKWKTKKDNKNFKIFNNVWAINQRVFLFSTKSYKDLLPELLKNRLEIYNTLRKYLEENEKERMFISGNKKLDKEKFEKGLKIDITIPAPYEIVDFDLNKNYVQFMRQNNDLTRIISIKAFKEYKKEDLNEKLALDLREKFAFDHYEGDKMYKDKVNIYKINFKGNENSFLIRGPWFNEKYKIGGMFLSIVYFDPKHKCVYLIDGTVFAPNENKVRYLTQFEIIFNSFVTL